jgi:hypothetical protein
VEQDSNFSWIDRYLVTTLLHFFRRRNMACSDLRLFHDRFRHTFPRSQNARIQRTQKCNRETSYVSVLRTPYWPFVWILALPVSHRWKSCQRGTLINLHLRVTDEPDGPKNLFCIIHKPSSLPIDPAEVQNQNILR